MAQDAADVAVRFIDDDAIYNVEASELPADVEEFNYDMYEGTPRYRPGVVRGSLPDDFVGDAIYLSSDPTCSISVKRLMWVDGWKGTDDGKAQGDDMTLVMLQLSFNPQGRGSKLSYASVRMVLGSDEKSDDGPEIVAWGPFRRHEMWNTTKVNRRFNIAPSLKFAGGGAGQQATAGIDVTNEFNWDQVHSDYGRSSELNGRRSRRCNGVLWEVFANPYKQWGITPELRVAALFRRPSNDKYRVQINVAAHKGLLNRWGDGLMHLLNRPGGHSVVWRTTPHPGEKYCCFGEGVDIAKDLDLTRLGNLVNRHDSKSLALAWLKTWDREEDPEDEQAKDKKTDDGKAENEKAEHKKAEGRSIEGKLDAPRTSRPEENPAAGTASRLREDVYRAGTGTDEPRRVVTPPQGTSASTAGIPPPYRLVAGAPRQDTTSADDDAQHLWSPPGRDRRPSPPPLEPPLEPRNYDRLVALEARAARAEARIAEQDRLIADLQQTLARVAHALLLPTLNSGRAG